VVDKGLDDVVVGEGRTTGLEMVETALQMVLGGANLPIETSFGGCFFAIACLLSIG
jgi:hypothetical protein